jgi:hypothetical protein
LGSAFQIAHPIAGVPMQTGRRMPPATKRGKVRLEEDVPSFSYNSGLESDFLENAKECREPFS